MKDWFVAHCVRSEADLRRVGKDAVGEGGFGARGPSAEERASQDTLSPVVPTREQIPIAVTGARNAAMSLVCRVFGTWSNSSCPVERRRRSETGGQ